MVDIQPLKEMLLFRNMSENEISLCLEALSGRSKKYRKGEFILHAGMVTVNMGIVLSGGVTIESNDMWGNCSVLSHAGSGGFFAETYALLPDTELLVDVRASVDSEILFLAVGNLDAYDSPRHTWQPKLIANLLTVSMHKNQTLSGRIFHTAPKKIRGRVLAYLNTVSIQKHAREFDIPFNRQQLADYLNVDRTALSKELAKMRTENILRCHGSHFELLDQPIAK